MQKNFRTLALSMGLMCMGLFSSANAHPHTNNSQMYGTPSQDSSDKAQGTYREITPNAGPRVVDGADVFITADFIWWKAVQEGTEYATTGFGGFNTDAGQINNVTSTGHTRNVGKDWAPGFKVGLGLNLCHDGWDVYAEYTWLRPSNSSSLSGNATVVGAQVFPATVVAAGDGPIFSADKASSNWNLDFNVIDAELGRRFYLSQFLTMRPFIGLKATWQNQQVSTRYTVPGGLEVGRDGNNQEIIAEGPYKIRENMDNWGIGVRGGFDASWYMAKQWSLYGNLAWTTMWVDYTEIKRKDTVDDPANASGLSSLTVYNTRIDDHYSVKGILELEFGLRWDIWFYDDKYHFAIQAGWEEQVWFSWGTNFDFLSSQSWHDLNFQGLNLKFRFDF